MAEEMDYWNALDRSPIPNPEKLDVDPLRVGISHGLGDVGEGLRVNIFRGATTVELGFMGRGKGWRSQPSGATPESFGSAEREDIRLLAKVNEVKLSTHASPDLGSMSGFTGEKFSKEAKQTSLHEISRAIEFAADTAEGGAVVVHLGSGPGEFPRPIFEADRDGDKEGRFEAYPEEKKKAPLFLVDKRTGELQGLRRDMEIPVPVTKIDEHGKEVYEYEDDGRVKMEVWSFDKFEEKAKEKGEEDPLKYFFKEYTNKQKEQAEGEELRWAQAAALERKRLENFRQIEKDYQGMLKEGDKDYAKRFLRRNLEAWGLKPKPLTENEKGPAIPEEHEQYLENPEEYLKQTIKEHEGQLKYTESISISAGRQVKEIESRFPNLEPIKDYGLREAKDTLATAAMTAFKTEKAKGLEKPLFISPENWNPESYGSHPKEYKEIIVESRKRMQEMLKNEGYKKEEAEKIAQEHIKGTFDIGHFNFWRKYFKPSDQKLGPDAVDKEFRGWMDEQLQELAKDNIIGNVHLSDNFGYHDEHLAPGEGNAPIEKFVRRLEEKGYKGAYIGEPGGQKEGFYHTAWTGSLNTLHSPIYRVNGAASEWSTLEHSYFGLAPPSPYFLVGDIAPSKDWTLWSEIPLE